MQSRHPYLPLTIHTLSATLILFAFVGLKESPAEDAPNDAPTVVKEISLKGLNVPPARRGSVRQPVMIDSAEKLAAAIEDKEARQKIQTQVDFSKQKLLLFRWSGSGQDKLTAAAEKDDEAKVVFQYRRGLTRDLRPHTHLFVVAKDAKWRLQVVR